MKRSEFEDILILETPYYKKLQKMYRETLLFKRYLNILKKIIRGNGFIDMLEKKDGKELVFLGRKIFSLQEEFVKTYLNYLTDESNINKWESFFERYSKNLFEISANFVSGDNNRALIFEIVNRKLLRDLLTKYTMNESLDKKILICERFGIVVNQLSSYIRNSLAKIMSIEDSLIIESFERIPLLPRGRFTEIIKLLSNQMLKTSLPEPVFMIIFKNISTTYYTETKEKIIKAINEKQTLSKDSISEIFSSYFFFPDEQSLGQILDLLKNKAREVINSIKEKRGAVEKRMLELKEKIKNTTKSLNEDLINLAENFSTEEAIDNMVKKLRRNLITDGYDLKIIKADYQKFFEQQIELNSVLGFNPSDLSKFIIKNDWDPFIILLFNKDTEIGDENLQLLLKDAMVEIKNNKAALNIMNGYRISGFLKERYNTEEINRRFRIIIEEIILPLVKSFLLEELIEYYPQLSGVVPTEGLRYLAEETVASRVSLVEKDTKVTLPSEFLPALNILKYQNLISVLIYDIRGSTFMGTKLKDAKKESEIRNLFQESVLSIVEKYGGIPIKDTGDGGIVLFTANHYEIKNKKTLVPEQGSTLSAVRSAIEMAQGAKIFVQDNINKYKEWFREAEERQIDFEGISYATLPPLYRSIFQIGVGISSGLYPKEVYLDKNAFGEFDLTGMLVREANFYSKVKTAGKSTVVCDDATVYNLLLNVDKFSFLGEGGLRTDPLLLDTEQGLEYWINQRVSSRGFILDLYKIFVAQLGEEMECPDGLKITLGSHNIIIDESGEIKDGKGGRGKFLFEISYEEK